MERRQRNVIGGLWIAVAAVMAITIEPTVPTTIGGFARIGVVVLALLLAVNYLVDPWGIIDRTHGD
ncbi:hypothetical protein [Natronosalvus vescus]|uniref:hypothetical protein n=1 Tax=Natronosalvus vescus TaxID=2953881 RepID=UPI0020906F77|nr:hypothetical protein [Natronosalvus vescus]